MVGVVLAQFNNLLLAASELNEADAATPNTLPEPVRQIAYMALLGIALLGMLMIVATLLGGHWVRRWGDHVRRPSVPKDVIIPRPSGSTPAPIADDHPNDGETIGGNDTKVG